jgi:lipid-A-disaccharide synthase
MAAQGFEAWWPSHKLSVFGYADALKHYPELLKIRRALRDRLLKVRPDLFIGVDAPDFNFGLERQLRAQGLKTVHFVCPSIWAWRADRVRHLAEAADHVLCLFPFEPDLLRRHGIAASFVGHPVADLIPMRTDPIAAKARLGFAPEQTVIALLPGSRSSEIVHIAPRMLQAAALMAAARPELSFLLPAAPGLSAALLPLIGRYAAGVNLQVLEGRAHDALAACDLTLIASGTATLEAALYKRPMVIVYRLGWLNWQIMKGRSLQPWFGLPNILCREFVVPELIQDAATPAAMAEAGMAWLNDAARREGLTRRFDELHLTLRQNTAQKVGSAIAQVLES